MVDPPVDVGRLDAGRADDRAVAVNGNSPAPAEVVLGPLGIVVL